MPCRVFTYESTLAPLYDSSQTVEISAFHRPYLDHIELDGNAELRLKAIATGSPLATIAGDRDREPTCHDRRRSRQLRVLVRRSFRSVPGSNGKGVRRCLMRCPRSSLVVPVAISVSCDAWCQALCIAQWPAAGSRLRRTRPRRSAAVRRSLDALKRGVGKAGGPPARAAQRQHMTRPSSIGFYRSGCHLSRRCADRSRMTQRPTPARLRVLARDARDALAGPRPIEAVAVVRRAAAAEPSQRP